MSLARDSLHTLLFQLSSLAVGVVTNLVVARTLGPEGKGVLSFLGYTLFVATVLGGLGLNVAAVQELGRKRFSEGTIARVQLVLGLFAGLLVALGIAGFLALYRDRMHLPAPTLLPFLAVAASSLLALNLGAILLGRGDVRDANRLGAVTPAVWLAGSVAVLWIARGGETAAVWTWMAAQLAGSVAMIAWVLQRVPARGQDMVPCARALLRFGSEAYVANLAWALLLRVDSLLLGVLSGPEAVGIYSIAVLMAEALCYLPRSLTWASSPRVAGGTGDDALLVTLRSARVGLALVGALVIALAIAAPLLIHVVFGDAFRGSVLPLWLLLPGMLANAVAAPVALYITQRSRRPRRNAVISGIALVLNLGMNLLWIPRYGASGAALVSSVTYLLVAGLAAASIRGEPGFRWSRLLVAGRSDLDALLSRIRA